MKKTYIIIAFIGLGILTTWYFTQTPQESSVIRTTSSEPQPPLEQGEVWGPHQDQIADSILKNTKGIVDKNHVSGQIAHRDAHPKAHGCVKATWNFLNSDLKAEQRVGVFAESNPINAWVRFSNGDPAGFDAPDSNTDIRGLAIKLMTAQGSQDFIMINSPRFFSVDGDDYINLFNALNRGLLASGLYFATHPTNLSIISKAKVTIDNVLSTNFFTPVPLKLGAQSMRMKAQPCDANLTHQPGTDHSHKNYLRESLLTSLKDNEVCFNIYVQPNNEPSKNNMEDPTLAWDESVSPFIKVARLDILQQEGFDSPERMAFCENLSFNPWHSNPELRPMGQINRIRKIVYDGVSKYRHGTNQTPEIEPTDHNACQGATAPLCKLQ